MPADRFRAYGPTGEVVHEGELTGAGAKFKTDAVVNRVVYYAGPLASEVVVANAPFGGVTGSITVPQID